MAMDGVVHMSDLLTLQVDPDAAMVDPQLPMPYFNNLSGKDAEPMTVDQKLRQNLIDDNNNADSTPYEIRKQAAKTTRTGSKSSVPSLSSGSSGSPQSPPTKHTRPKTTKKQESKAARKKQKTSKLASAEITADEDDSKRNKHLESNKVAAAKCRQKKKVWVNDLHAKESELEHKHRNLQRANKSLINEIAQLKNQLMAHAGCGDPRIDGWIETEAERFVQRTTNTSRGRCLSGSSDRRSSSNATFNALPRMEPVITPSPPLT